METLSKREADYKFLEAAEDFFVVFFFLCWKIQGLKGVTYVKTPLCFGTVLKLKKDSFWKSIWKCTCLAPLGKESFWSRSRY